MTRSGNIPSVSTTLLGPIAPLEESIARFWHMGDAAGAVSVDTHASLSSEGRVLRELGPSPFDRGRFPLVGFLATAYDRIARDAQERLAEWAAHHEPPASRPE